MECPHHRTPESHEIEFIRLWTRVASPPLVPEVHLLLGDSVTPLWEALETAVESQVPPPFWAFAWPGGQALARFLLDHPETVRGGNVLDFGAGSGLTAIASRMAGAARVVAADLDPWAAAAIHLNADLNSVSLEVTTQDMIGDSLDGVDFILIGDMCYEKPLAGRIVPWLARLVHKGKTVLVGDPGRNYLPAQGLVSLCAYDIPTTEDLESRPVRHTTVYRWNS